MTETEITEASAAEFVRKEFGEKGEGFVTVAELAQMADVIGLHGKPWLTSMTNGLCRHGYIRMVTRHYPGEGDDETAYAVTECGKRELMSIDPTSPPVIRLKGSLDPFAEHHTVGETTMIWTPDRNGLVFTKDPAKVDEIKRRLNESHQSSKEPNDAPPKD